MTGGEIIEFLKEDIKKYEKPSRYAHTMGVLDECAYIAKKTGLDDGDALCLFIAALCHDITKNLSGGEHAALCLRHGIEYNDSPVLHQDTAAAFITEKYGTFTQICDGRVLSAVSKHTTGGDCMTLIDTALFVADFTEAGRKYDICVKMREYLHGICEKISENDMSAARAALYETARTICEHTVNHLEASGEDIDPRTYKTLAFFTKPTRE